MKNVWICGDSFGVSDSSYGACWADLLGETNTVTNVCRVCASNTVIALQVDQAIAAQPDFIIVLFTASTREETRRNGQVIPYSIHSLDHTTPFNTHELEILQHYAAEFFDIDLAIYKNSCIIESVLHRLVHSGIPFVFDQGGFEHTSYGGVGKYFANFDHYRSGINLWDYVQTRAHRPYYHITDSKVHRTVANYYQEKING